MSEVEKELPVYPPVMDYLSKKNQTLINDYKTEDGNYSEHCGLIASDIAGLFLQGGERPSIISIRGETLPDGINRKTLVPKLFDGRVRWGSHTVCAIGDTIYDPMVGKPMKAEDYRREVFTELVNLEQVVPEEFMEEFLQRGTDR